MTLDEYIQYLESPLSIDADAIEPLRDLLGYAPYCVSARLLLEKALFAANRRKEASRELQRTILSAPQDVSVYFLLNPKPIKRAPQAKRKDAEPFVGQRDITYFELVDRMQDLSHRTGLSFEELAKRYLEARQYSISQ